MDPLASLQPQILSLLVALTPQLVLIGLAVIAFSFVSYLLQRSQDAAAGRWEQELRDARRGYKHLATTWDAETRYRYKQGFREMQRKHGRDWYYEAGDYDDAYHRRPGHRRIRDADWDD